MEERRREQGDKKLIWECYVGNEARVSQLLQHLPVHVETYSEQNGWDFSKPQVRGAFLARRSLLHPDEIMMSPRHTHHFLLWTISGVFKTSFPCPFRLPFFPLSLSLFLIAFAVIVPLAVFVTFVVLSQIFANFSFAIALLASASFLALHCSDFHRHWTMTIILSFKIIHQRNSKSSVISSILNSQVRSDWCW